MSELSAMLADSVERLLSATAASAPGFDARLWSEIETLGLPSLLIDAEQGGVGATWDDALEVLQAVGRRAIALPIVESILAARLAGSVALPLEGVSVAAPAETSSLEHRTGQWLFTGRLRGVPWGRDACTIVTAAVCEGTSCIVLLPGAAAQLRKGQNLAFEPRDDLKFESCAARVAPSSAMEASHLFDYCALLRLAQIVGALQAALRLSLDYARERKQFGRPIGQFQAVQQQLAQFGAETAAVACATRAAFRAAAMGDAVFQTAAAKLRANMAIGSATAIAHQVHGAIGFTWEHPLHRLTQRLMSWRSEFGNDRYWAERLGASITQRGAEYFWSDLTARDDVAALGCKALDADGARNR